MRTRTLLAACLLIAGSSLVSNAGPQSVWYDPFTSLYSLTDGALSPDGKWNCAWTGYGVVRTESPGGNPSNLAMRLQPATATSAENTHSSLALTTTAFSDHVIDVDVRTVEQLRVQRRGKKLQSRPNPWEVAWLLWRYSDANHFYYFMVKPNGTELGKVQGGVQYFLVTTSSPQLKLGSWNRWTVSAQGNRMTVYVDGVPVADYTDTDAPAVFQSGRVGLYTEDAAVHFDNVQVTY